MFWEEGLSGGSEKPAAFLRPEQQLVCKSFDMGSQVGRYC